MANKLTKEKIDLLIEQTLNEISQKEFTNFFGASIAPTDIESGLIDKALSSDRAYSSLASISEKADEFDEKDLEDLIKNPEKITTEIQASLISILEKNSLIQGGNKELEKKTRDFIQTIESISLHFSNFKNFYNEKVKTIKKAITTFQKKKPTNHRIKKEFPNYRTLYDLPSKPNPLSFKGKELKDYFKIRPFIVKVIQDYEEDIDKADNLILSGNKQISIANEIKYLPTGFLENFKSNKNKKYIADKVIQDVNFILNHVKPRKPSAVPYSFRWDNIQKARQFIDDDTKKQEINELAKLAKAALDSLEDAIKIAGAQPQTVSGPDIRTQRGSVTDAEEPLYINKTIENLKLQGDIQQNMRTLTEISKKYYEASLGNKQAIAQLETLQGKDLSKMLAEVSVLDMFNNMSKEFDSGAGAYIFEYLLAIINGGKVLGKETTEQGQMGAVDFIDKDKKLGSAKYYAKAEGIEQSAKGFRDEYKKNGGQRVDVRYVIAKKIQGIEQISTLTDPKKRRGTSDPSRLIGLEIYTPNVSFYMKDGKEVFMVDGKVATVNKDDKIMISSVLPASIGVLYIAQLRTKTFRQMINEAMEKTGGTPEKVFIAFQEYFDLIKTAKESGKAYTQTGDVDSANEATAALNDSKKRLKILAQLIFENESEIDSDASLDNQQLQFQEQNQTKSLKELDKLIERVILNKMNKL